MSINWFEGGRRITQLFMASAALIGAYNAYFEFMPPALEFSTGSPRDGWQANLPPENPDDGYPGTLLCSENKMIYDFEIKPGLLRSISLCFQPDDQGNIVYYSATDEEKYLKRVEGAVAKATGEGDIKAARELAVEAARTRLSIREAEIRYDQGLTSEEVDLNVSNYVLSRVAEFAIDPDTAAKIDKELPRIEREAFFEHAKEVLSIAAYFVGGFWIFSFVMGWVIRGFAGIPKGQDFRPASAKNLQIEPALDEATQ
jgi:hypothetical protein